MDCEKQEFVSHLDEPQSDTQEAWAEFRGALREAVARQITEDDPPHVWQTARRLLDAGMARHEVWHQLVLAYVSRVVAAAGGEAGFDWGGYIDALARLPVPPADQVEGVIVELVRERQPVAADEVDRIAAQRLGLLVDDPVAEVLFDRVQERLLEGPLAMAAPDRLVHVPSLLDGVVLTHRLTEAEREAGVLVAADLSAFGRLGLRYHGEPVVEYLGDRDGRSRWSGPSGWLDTVPAGALLAVRVGGNGEVELAVLDEEPAASGALVASVRAAYDAEVAEPWLPLSAEDLLVAVLARDRAAFTVPAPPLGELAAAAGLQQRGERYAHDESLWRQERLSERDNRLLDRLGPTPEAHTAGDILATLDEGAKDTAAAREALRGLHDPEVLEVVADELFGIDDEVEVGASVAELADRLLVAASRSAEQAAAHWLAALACERRAAVLDAESQLRAAVRADPGWEPAEDRLAWYESDRGDAAAAAARWHRLGLTSAESQDLATVEPFVPAQAAPKLGRNQPCWCGSGRKYKLCHLGKPVHAPLPDRVSWLCRKAVAYLERRGGVFATVLDYAAARAGAPQDPDDVDAVRNALGDPLVLDVVLHEGGWFGQFLTERGALLPADEVLLAQSWMLVERSVYEVLDVDPGRGLTVRDLRTGDRMQVRERTLSQDTHTGALVCARVVPDGESHQLIGGLFRVAPGTETQLLDLLDRRDGYELLDYVAELDRPPTLITSDGDPLLDCRVELDVPDPDAARAQLNHRYEADGDGWVRFGEPDEYGARTVRAWLHLVGQMLTVRTASEPRLEATLTELRGALPGAVVTRDERAPMEPDASADTPIGEVPQEVLLELAERQERKWCDESIPALGDRTPREAVADPTRRDEVARLITSFPDSDPASGVIGLRPARLRELLGLQAGE